jgi:creatinine amidohydrolase
MNREIDLSVSTYGVARQYKYDVAILPWGATEPHNLHLPYMTDCILSHAVAVDAAERALKEYGVRCMVLPPVMMGSQNPGQRDLPFCIHYHYETQFAILKDIVASLVHQGLRRLLIINGHGGNSFKQMIRDMEAPLSSPEGDTNASKTIEAPSGAVGGAPLIASAEWFKMAPAKDYFDQPGDHADEIETSVMMHYHPELVRLEEAGEGRSRQFAIPALREGKVWMPRHWTLVTEDTGIGNPALSTAEKGRRFADACADGFAQFLRDFARINSQEDLYEKNDR